MIGTDWDNLRSPTLRAAWQEVESELERDRLAELLSRHVPLLASIIDSKAADPSQIEIVVADLREAGFADWATRFEARQLGQLSINPSDVAVDLVVGHAAALHFIAEPSARRAANGGNLMRLYGDAWQSFSGAAAGVVVARPEFKVPLVAYLESEAKSFAEGAGYGPPIRGRDARQIVEAYRNSPRLAESWQELPGSEGLWFDRALEFDVLRRCDPAEFIRLADLLPHPEPVRHVLRPAATRATWEEMLELFRLTPPAFDKDGRWLVPSKTPFVVASCLVERLADLASDDGYNTNLSHQWPSLVGHFVDQVSSRTDFQFFGYALLQRLIEADGFRKRRGQANEVEAAGYCNLLLALASALPVRSDLVEWVEEEGDVWRRSRAVAAVAGCGLGNQASTDAATRLIEACLGQSLLMPVNLERSLAVWTRPERFLMGQAIASFASPDLWLTDLWGKLASIRDRSRHLSANQSEHAGNADHILVSWALCGLGAMEPGTPRARAFWIRIHQALHETTLTQLGSGRVVDWRVQYRFLAGLLAVRAAESDPSQTLKDLQALLTPLLCVDLKLFDVLVMLRHNGMPANDILAAVPDPKRLIELVRRIDAEQRELRQMRARMGQREPDDPAIGALALELEVAMPPADRRPAG